LKKKKTRSVSGAAKFPVGGVESAQMVGWGNQKIELNAGCAKTPDRHAFCKKR